MTNTRPAVVEPGGNRRRTTACLLLINDFSHDLFTGLWLTSFFALTLVYRRYGRPGLPTAAAGVIRELLHLFFWLETISLLFVMVTGIIRFLHTRNRLREEGARVRRDLLIIKHAVLGLLFIGGSVGGYLMAF